jgi:hypothetical protein
MQLRGTDPENREAVLAELEHELAELNLSGDIWLAEDGSVKRISLRTDESDSLNLNLEFTLTDLNQPVDLQAPSSDEAANMPRSLGMPELESDTPDVTLDDLDSTDSLPELSQ